MDYIIRIYTKETHTKTQLNYVINKLIKSKINKNISKNTFVKVLETYTQLYIITNSQKFIQQGNYKQYKNVIISFCFVEIKDNCAEIILLNYENLFQGKIKTLLEFVIADLKYLKIHKIYVNEFNNYDLFHSLKFLKNQEVLELQLIKV